MEIKPVALVQQLWQSMVMRKGSLLNAVVVLPIALLACGSGDTSETNADFVPRAGKWEITTNLTSYSGEQFTGKEALMSELAEQRSKELKCFDRQERKVGELTAGGRCRFTQVSDVGSKVHRVARCDMPNNSGSRRMVETIGTRSAKAYDLTISIRDDASDTGKLIGEVKTREVGRWIGDCR